MRGMQMFLFLVAWLDHAIDVNYASARNKHHSISWQWGYQAQSLVQLSVLTPLQHCPVGFPVGNPSYWYPAHAAIHRLTPQFLPETPVRVESAQSRSRASEKLGT